MNLASKAKAVTYLILVPLVIGSVIFLVIGSALGLIKLPFMGNSHMESEEINFTEQLEKKEETIASLREIIEKQKDELQDVIREYELKEESLNAREQSLDDFEEELNNRLNGLEEEEERIKNMAMNFIQMKARDAADILIHLEDGEILKIFHHMTTKQTSEILSAFSNEKAAALARKMMQ